MAFLSKGGRLQTCPDGAECTRLKLNRWGDVIIETTEEQRLFRN